MNCLLLLKVLLLLKKNLHLQHLADVLIQSDLQKKTYPRGSTDRSGRIISQKLVQEIVR